MIFDRKSNYRLNNAQKRIWGVGAAIFVVGGLIKFGYFYLSRDIIIKNLEKNDKSARSYLRESREFARWSALDREKRLVKLTEEQRIQLQNYLELMKEHESNKDVYPHENGKSKLLRKSAQ